jgi:PPOX class probable F420-dependent enzyme
VDIDAAIAFLREHHRAVLHTFRSDGSPQLSPITVGADDEGRAIVSSRETAVKVKNLERDPRASLCVFTDAFYGRWIRLDGTTEIVHLPAAMDLLEDYYRRLSGEHPDWDDYRRAMEEERRVVLRITPTSAGPDVSG